MKLLLIYPSVHETDYHNHFSLLINKINYNLAIGPTMTLQDLAIITPNKYDIEIIDEAIQKINFDTDVDIVGITTFTMTAPRAYDIADEFRKRGIKVVLGGWHVSALPKEAKKHSDSVIIGEAEDTWLKFLEDFEKKKN